MKDHAKKDHAKEDSSREHSSKDGCCCKGDSCNMKMKDKKGNQEAVGKIAITVTYRRIEYNL